MNPFDLPGPEFLVYYAVLGVVVLMALYLRRGMTEPSEPPHVRFEDPYLIAFLRGGKNEALRVATVSLIDRGVLKWEGTVLSATQNLPKRPIEQALVRKFTPFADATSIFNDAPLEAACDDYRTMLTRLGLVPDEAHVAARRRRLWLALAVLVGVSATKIWVALGRGKPVAFLVIVTIIAVIAAVNIHNPLRTPAGNQLLADLRALFSRLKERAHTLRPGGESSEVALLAAVFGVGALSHILFPYARQLFPRASSSAGSSCGSSCGGGGDGGGGGGCGGCGGGGGD